MAPNRKSVTSLVESLSHGNLQGLQDTIQPKYLPLTHPQEAAAVSAVADQQQTLDVRSKALDTSASASYWDWPAFAPQRDEAAPVDLFSANHLVANLTKDAAKQKESETNATFDDYWSDDDSTIHSLLSSYHLPQHSYWEWPASHVEEDTKQAMIQRILADERARALVSGATLEATERAAAAASAATSDQEPVRMRPVSSSSTNYWRWEAAIYEKVWEASQGVHSLLEYETARQFLTADKIVEQLQTWKEPVADAAQNATQASSDNYWSWAQPVC